MFVTINLNLLCLYPIKFLKYSGKIDLLIEYSASSPSRKKCINLVTIFPNTVKLCMRFVRQEKCLFLWPHYHRKYCCGFVQEAVFVYI